MATLDVLVCKLGLLALGLATIKTETRGLPARKMFKREHVVSYDVQQVSTPSSIGN